MLPQSHEQGFVLYSNLFFKLAGTKIYSKTNTFKHNQYLITFIIQAFDKTQFISTALVDLSLTYPESTSAPLPPLSMDFLARTFLFVNNIYILNVMLFPLYPL
jgi:hypothetical protein